MEHRPTVLLVDDDRAVCEPLIRLLSGAGHDVLVAEDGHQGLERLATPPLPCAILLDLMMPGMDGFTFWTMATRDRAVRDVPVALFTAFPMAHTAKLVPAAAVFVKPADLDAVLRFVVDRCPIRTRASA